MVILLAACAPPILGIVGASNFVVETAGTTSTGKTTVQRLGASVWGCPDERAEASCLHTWDTTRVWVERVGGLLDGLPLILDDTKRVFASLPKDQARSMAALEEYLAAAQPEDKHYLFKSRKTANSPLTTLTITKKVKAWAAAINLKGNFGAHTLRKTWTYHQRREFGVSWEILAKRLNHSSPSVTRRYLGVQDEEVEQVLMATGSSVPSSSSRRRWPSGRTSSAVSTPTMASHRRHTSTNSRRAAASPPPT